LLKFEGLLETYIAFAPRFFASFRMAMPVWLREKLFHKNLLCHKLKPIGGAHDWATRLLFFRTPLGPCRQRLLRLAL